MSSIDPTALGKVLDKLASRGRAERRARSRHRRTRSQAITKAGKELLPFIWGIVAESEAIALAGLSGAEHRLLVTALGRALANLKIL